MTGNNDDSVYLFENGELKKSRKFEGFSFGVQFINEEIVLATETKLLSILDENLDRKKTFNGEDIENLETDGYPDSFSGNKTFIAVGLRTKVRYYRRNGDTESFVRHIFYFLIKKLSGL